MAVSSNAPVEESANGQDLDAQRLRDAPGPGQGLLPLADDLSPAVIVDGTEDGDVIDGTAGSDTIVGHAGWDILRGHAGADQLLGGSGSDTLDGGDGNDRLVAGHGGEWDDDTLVGGGGNDVLLGGYGNDGLDGGDGDDILISGLARLEPGSDIPGDADGDQLSGGAGDDTLIGSGMADRLRGGDGDDVFSAGDGQDILHGDPGADLLDGGEGQEDYVDYRSSDAGVTVDLVDGIARGGHAHGDLLRNIERVRGSDHDDMLAGNDADNDLFGFLGNDLLRGGDGNDSLGGGMGDDILEGGAGDDRLRGEIGADRINGGAGSDTVSFYSFDGTPGGVRVDLMAGTVSGGEAEGDTISLIENVEGSLYDDVLIGDDGSNRLTGSDGADILRGGAGADSFLFNSSFESDAYASDTIEDFTFTEGDRIDLSLFHGNSEAAVDLMFIGYGGFTGEAGQLRFVQANRWTDVEADMDGDGAADFAVTLAGVTDPLGEDVFFL